MNRRTRYAGLFVFCAAVAADAAAQSQWRELLNRVTPPSLRASESGEQPAAQTPFAPAADKTTSATIMAGAGVEPTDPKKVAAELAPDRQCLKPQERFDVLEKAREYGGTAASLRLEQLLKSDGNFEDLTPEDKAMLKYLAYTTVWIPVDVELKLGRAIDAVDLRSKEPLNELQEANKQTIDEQLDQLRGAVADFPGKMKLVVNNSMTDGAAAKFGGTLQLSPQFVEKMLDPAAQSGGNLVLAHEMSHVYKRHAVKEMQFQLLSTRDGWVLGRKLMKLSSEGGGTLNTTLFMVTTMPKLVDFVQSLQLRFTREQELEADACSVIWLKTIKVDPAQAWDQYVGTFAAADAAAGAYGAKHPPNDERAANFKTKVEGKAPAKAATGSPVRASAAGQRKPAAK